MGYGQGAQRLLQIEEYQNLDAAMIPTWMPWGGTAEIQASEPIELQASSPMPGVCTTCTAMCGSGVRIGTGKTIRPVLLPIPLGLHQVRTGCSVAAVGTVAPGTAGQPIVVGASLATAAASWVSGLLFPQVNEPSGARNRTLQPRN